MSDDIDLPVPEQKILGTHTFKNVLFTAESESPTNVMTGETPEYAKATVADARAFAERLSKDNEKPYVAKSASVETQVETQSAPYTGCVFHHFSLVGGMDMHKAFSAVWDSPKYDVTVDTDYETGLLTISVSKR